MQKEKIKVLISNMAWIDKKRLSDVDIFQLKKKLTIMPKVMAGEGAQSIEMYRERPDAFGVPRNYFRKYMHSYQIYDIFYDVCEGRPIPNNSFKINLREDQEAFCKQLVASLTTGIWGCGIGEAYTGFGKSVCGIKIAQDLHVNTLILVHNEEIMQVWKNAIKTFYPNASVGIIQGSECDYKKDFVIGMCQSLMNDSGKYPQEIYTTFGLLFVDEVHRFGSRAFGSVAPRFNPRYIFGLSGTVRRQDDCEEVFHWNIGDIVAKSENTNRVMPMVWWRDTALEPPYRVETYIDVSGRKCINKEKEDISAWSRPKLLRYLGSDAKRLKMIAGDVIACLKKNRNPLLVSERKDPLHKISRIIDDLIQNDPFFVGKRITHGFYFGGNDDKETSRARLDAASRCTIIYATLQKAKEGVDIVRLDTLFLVTPNTDTEQVCGRVCRPTVKNVEGKMVNQERMQPLVFDYVDTGIKSCRSSFQHRLDLYSRLNWRMMDLHKIGFGD